MQTGQPANDGTWDRTSEKISQSMHASNSWDGNRDRIQRLSACASRTHAPHNSSGWAGWLQVPSTPPMLRPKRILLGMSTLAELIQPVRLLSQLTISYHVSSCVIVAPCAHALPSLDCRAQPRFPGLFYPIGPPVCSLPSLCSTFRICVLLVRFVVSAVGIR